MPELDGLKSLGLQRYQSNAAALPMTPGAKLAGQRMERAMKRAGKVAEAFDLLTRIARAGQRNNRDLLAVLAVEAEALVAETGGAA